MVEDGTLHGYDLLGIGLSFSVFSGPFIQPLEIEHKGFIFRGYKNIFAHTCLMLRVTHSLLELRCSYIVLQAVTYCSLFTIVILIGAPFMPLVLLVRQQHVLKCVRCCWQSRIMLQSRDVSCPTIHMCRLHANNCVWVFLI